MLREVLDSGVPAPERVVRLSLRDGPGRTSWAGVWAFRLEDQHGAFLGLAAVLADLSERERMRSRWHIFTKLRAQVGQTSDVMAACQDLADALVPFFADIAVVEVVDSVFRGEDPPLAPLGREVPRRAGLQCPRSHADRQRVHPRRAHASLLSWQPPFLIPMLAGRGALTRVFGPDVARFRDAAGRG